MRRYETIFIADPDLTDDERQNLSEKVLSLIPQYQGVLLEDDTWGIRKLAYEIKKKMRGYYTRLDYCGDGSLVDEMERTFRIDDRVLKYMTILLDPMPDMEKVKEELAAKEAEKSQKTAGQETPDNQSDSSEGQDTESKADAPETNATETKNEE